MTIKDDVLRLLEQSRGVALSGQTMAQQLGVSRNAVWKAISALKQEGYRIESSTNKGYLFSSDNDIISQAGIRAAMASANHGVRIEVLEQTDSTNEVAKRLLAQGCKDTMVVIAQRQTAGKGRRGRQFFSPQGGIYLSVALQNHSSTTNAVLMTMAAAVATARAIEANSACVPQIKWVNDVYVDGKKACGILTEGIADLETGMVQSVVVGIGVNVGPVEFPAELADKATSIELAPGCTRNTLAAAIVDELLQLNVLDGSDGAASSVPAFVDEYRSRSLVLGRMVRYDAPDGSKNVRAVSIADDGALVVEDERGNLSHLHGGEISIVL